MFKLEINLVRIAVLLLFFKFGAAFIYDNWGGTLTWTDVVVFSLAQILATFKIELKQSNKSKK